MSIRVNSECAFSKRPMIMEIDSDMNCSCEDRSSEPVIFVPEVDFKTLKQPNIIDAF